MLDPNSSHATRAQLLLRVHPAEYAPFDLPSLLFGARYLERFRSPGLARLVRVQPCSVVAVARGYGCILPGEWRFQRRLPGHCQHLRGRQFIELRSIEQLHSMQDCYRPPDTPLRYLSLFSATKGDDAF